MKPRVLNLWNHLLREWVLQQRTGSRAPVPLVGGTDAPGRAGLPGATQRPTKFPPEDVDSEG